MRKLGIKIQIICILCFSQAVSSLEVHGLYEAEVITKSQAHADRHAALREAMTIVLTKILAGDQILSDPTVQAALANAPDYVSQYQYSLISSDADTDNTARVMRVVFDEVALLEILKTSQLSLWSEIRDALLVWLVVEKDGKRRLFNEQQMPEISNALGYASKRKGIPLLFPLMDLEEQRRISVNDVLSAYSERLMEASKRYKVVSVLSGKVKKKQTCWVGEWTFYFDDAVYQWSIICRPLNEVMLTGVQGVYNRLSKYYAVKPEPPEIGTLTLKISGIKGMTDMTRVTDYLNSLPMIESLSWQRVEMGNNIYKVKITGKPLDFFEMLGLGRVLDPISQPYAGREKLNYKLLPKQKR